MKQNIFLGALALATAFAAQAQDFDNNPTVKIDNDQKALHFTIGARMMMDAAYYHTDFTPMKSGAKLTDARIRTSMAYKDWYFYADFDFSGGKFSQKNMFLRYSFKPDRYGGVNRLQAGYFQNPSGGMARATSLGSLHFISRSAAINSLADGRALGVAYNYYNRPFYSNIGIFSENLYNDQAAGYQGISVGGRWAYRPINNGREALHIGFDLGYDCYNTGVVESNGVKKTELVLGSSMETYVDPTQFVDGICPYARDVWNIGAELMYVSPKFFARGEYRYKRVAKSRDDQALFEANLGSIDSWATLESWQAGNPLKTNNFQGAYVEAGYKFFGPDYKYSSSEGIMSGLTGQALELVARYSYTDLDDKSAGEVYFPARDQYYPNGVITDYPAVGRSVGGGTLHSVTVGLNYSFNKFVQIMLEYNYNHLSRDKYTDDTNFNTVQGRLQFTF